VSSYRVTDLEKFSLEDVWRPYWRSYDRGDLPRPVDAHGNLVRPAAPPLTLAETAAALRVDDRWSRLVIQRLARCDVEFPEWVRHGLVDVVRDLVAAWWDEAGEVSL
jgi:hypothetical protein